MKDDERDAFQLTVEVMAKCIADQQKEIERLNGPGTIRVSQDTILKLICDVQKLKHERRNEPRVKPPLCTFPSLCPYYTREDDPIQYPCIMCGCFARRT